MPMMMMPRAAAAEMDNLVRRLNDFAKPFGAE